MAGTQPGLETSKWAPPKQQLQMMAKPKPFVNPNLATSLNLGLAPATPKSKSAPLLGAADSSSPAVSEVITPQKTKERRESYINSVHKVAAEVSQDDTGMSKAPHLITYLPDVHPFTHLHLHRIHHPSSPHFSLPLPLFDHNFHHTGTEQSAVTSSRHLRSLRPLEAHPALNCACWLPLTRRCFL